MKKTITILILFSTLCLWNTSSWGRNAELVPIVRISPQYPYQALLDRTEGWVKVLMHINAQGSVDHVEVVGSKPTAIFDQEAIKAAKYFKFMPRVVNGVPVAAKATQTIEFSLAESKNAQKSLQEKAVIALLRTQFESWAPVSEKVILADSVRIKSKIKPKGVEAVDVFFGDDMLTLNSKPYIWGGLKAAKQKLINFEQELQDRKTLINHQYQSTPGIYKRFHRIQAGKKLPPALITSVDLLAPDIAKTAKNESYELTISNTGKVLKWKSLDKTYLTNNPNYRQTLHDWFQTLQFSPAFKKGKAVQDKIKIQFKTYMISRQSMVQEAINNNRTHVFDKHWVKQLLRLNSKGRVADSHIIASSHEMFEAAANQAISNMPVLKGRTQTIKLIEFEQTQNN